VTGELGLKAGTYSWMSEKFELTLQSVIRRCDFRNIVSADRTEQRLVSGIFGCVIDLQEEVRQYNVHPCVAENPSCRKK
jgi:hypothetical protein